MTKKNEEQQPTPGAELALEFDVPDEQELSTITLNDAYIGSDEDDPETYYPGKLAAEGAAEAIVLTLSGPAMPTWCLTQRYTRTDSGVEFGKLSEDRGTQMSLLEGWATENPQIN